MGIPKFFRYISERYPMTSQLIQENKIPEFDNLYLDFNGIIHNCSHPNDGDAHFRMSEEQIFTSIFSYVDMLFGKIKPKKLFFMAVDGVAPRAKMNQQRSRRFRTAKEAQEVREKAEMNGEKLPEEKAFDSNCITPGTPFMARLSDQLRYFVNKKITEDANWRDIQVVLSGHEVPGEGEHKIMEYIRLSKAQPDYDSNVRHCMYGLDADLVMLGLLSHDPHFCLLREEVKFGPARSKKNNSSLDSINFYLLHLSLLREYLNLEFRDISSSLSFEYNMERIIDDFILLAVFVGNDFLPNLPDLHIHENGLEKLFEVYKKVLPELGGYLNESGVIDTKRLQIVLDEMADWEREIFEKEYADLNWYKGKQAKFVQEMDTARKRSQLVLTKPQRIIFEEVKQFILQQQKEPTPEASLTMPNMFPARERRFISLLADDLNLDVSWDEYDDEDQNLVVWRLPESAATHEIQNGDVKSNVGDSDEGDDVDNNNEEEDDGQWEDVDSSDDNMESKAAIDRVLKKYEKAPVKDEDEDGDFDARHERGVQEKMDEWKRNYYMGKLEISYDDSEAMGALMFRYVEGLQWVMHYYYSGVVSWGWFYNYHYAPRISDIKNVDKMTFQFELSQPFKPFEQLMGVLPEASKEHIPLAYRDLMYDPNSPILDFFPREFDQDLNGKKQDWEAIVKIPFINEKRLLKAMAAREHRLTDEERRRNTWGSSIKFTFNPNEPFLYPSSLPGFFPAIARCTCKMEPFDLPTLDGLHLVPGLCDGVFLGAEALAGFPSLKTLPYSAQLGYHGVNVHGSESKNRSMIVHIKNMHEDQKTEAIATKMIGKRTWYGWPYLQEATVIAVSDSYFKFEKVAFGDGKQERVLSNPHSPQGQEHWKWKTERMESFYSKRLGVITGPVEVLLHVRPLKGLKRLDTGAFVKDYEGAHKETEQALQLSVSEVFSEDPRFKEKDAPTLSEDFPSGAKVFFLGEPAYGVAAQVSDTEETTLSVILAFFPSEKTENESFKDIVMNRISSKYLPSFTVANILGITGYALSKITSSFMVLTQSDNVKVNLGLSLKFEAKALKVLGYSRKDGRFWEFSEKAIELIKEYKLKFPEVFAALAQSGNEMVKAYDVFPQGNADAKVKEVRSWLASKGVRDFEAVSLFCDQLDKVTVSEICKLADDFTSKKSIGSIKKAIVKGIPRQAILKPSHAKYRLQNQMFSLGERVTMVQDSGSVPLAVKGVVVGLNENSMDVVWDVPFMGGGTLGDRCPPYRGSTVEFNTCLNISKPQFVMSTNSKAQNQQLPQYPPFKPKFGPRPSVQAPSGQTKEAGFRPAHAHSDTSTPSAPPMRIIMNPSRGRGSAPINANGRENGSVWSNGQLNNKTENSTESAEKSANEPPAQVQASSNANTNNDTSSISRNESQTQTQMRTQTQTPPSRINSQYSSARGRGVGFGSSRGHSPTHTGTRGGFNPAFRGRGGFSPNPAFSRGRGDLHHRGGNGFRGRGRGVYPNQEHSARAVTSN